jgi:hypothetical protein
MFEQYMLPTEEMKLCEDPFCLSPPLPQGQKRRPPTTDERDHFSMRYHKHLNRWTYPFQFAPINSRVVRRSHGFLNYSPHFRCAHLQFVWESPADARLSTNKVCEML